MTSKTAKNADTPKRESFLMECVVKPIVKKLSGLLVTVLVVIAIATYVGKLIPSLFPQEVTISEVVIEEKLQALGELVTAEHTKSGVKTWGHQGNFPWLDGLSSAHITNSILSTQVPSWLGMNSQRSSR